MLRLKTLFLLLILLSASVAESQARGQATRRSGVVQAVDQTKHTFTLLPDGASKPVVIEWRQKSGFLGGFKTEFFADQDPASEVILKKGIRVEVRYQETLLAANAAILVRWLQPPPVPHP